jgi:ATP-dependent DNA ligase
MPEPRGVRGSRLARGARPWLGALLLAYYDPDGRLVYAGRVGTGIAYAELGRLRRRLQPLATSEMPLDKAPPRTNRFGSPLVLSCVHWVRPELLAEVKYLTWTDENMLRQVVYKGLREEDPAEVRRTLPHSKPIVPAGPTVSAKTAYAEMIVGAALRSDSRPSRKKHPFTRISCNIRF